MGNDAKVSNTFHTAGSYRKRAGDSLTARILINEAGDRQVLKPPRQTELAEQSPSHVACRWIGNGQQVTQKHYLQTTPEHYVDAVSGGRTISVATGRHRGSPMKKATLAKLQNKQFSEYSWRGRERRGSFEPLPADAEQHTRGYGAVGRGSWAVVREPLPPAVRRLSTSRGHCRRVSR